MEVSCKRHDALRRGGTASTCWKSAPALETPITAPTSKPQTHAGVDGWFVMDAHSCLVGGSFATNDACSLEEDVDECTYEDVDEDETGHANRIPST